MQWLRAARADKQRRTTAVWYAVGTTVVQVLWLLRLALPDDWSTPAFLLLVIVELIVPIVAESAPGGPTTYHPHHIAERYGLFTIIMLGESVSAATIAIRAGLDTGEHAADLISLAVAGGAGSPGRSGAPVGRRASPSVGSSPINGPPIPVPDPTAGPRGPRRTPAVVVRVLRIG